MGKQLPWHLLLKRERLRHGWSQDELARQIGSTAKTVGRWEKGQTQMPGPYLRRQIAQAFGMNLEDLGLFLDEGTQEAGVGNDDLVHHLSLPVNWGEAPPVAHLLGREKELHLLADWMRNDACHIVAILGPGGIGKTALGRIAAQQLQNHFTRVYWRSLQQTPPLELFFEQYFQFFFQTRQLKLPQNKDELFSLLLASFREQTCLLILDNFESILAPSPRANRYKQGFEDYGHLLQLIGEAEHTSCLLVTSREKPGEIARLEGKQTTVHSLRLRGIGQIPGRQLLQTLELHGSHEAQTSLVQLYAGNPLALKLVAGPIRELFGGNITDFLQEKESIFGEITALLDEQFEPLGIPEQEVLYWLVIEQEPVSVHELRPKIVNPATRHTLLTVIESLLRRSLIEVHDYERLTLQPIVMEYITSQFVETIFAEIALEKPIFLESHAFLQAEAKDYIRFNQEQVILKNLAERLVAALGKEELVKKLQRILSVQNATRKENPGYTAGNILNLLIYIQADLRSINFSSQTIRQAYLQGVNLTDVTFASADLATSVFTDTFSSILCVSLSANGTLLAAGTTTGEVRLWQAETLTPLFTCSGHLDGVRSLAFSPDGHLLVSGSEDFTVKIWDMDTGQCSHTFAGHYDKVYAVAFSPDGWTIASGSEDKTVRIWNAASGQGLAVLHGHTRRVRSVAFNLDGNVLASGSDDATVCLWNMRTYALLNTFKAHKKAVRIVSYMPQDDVLVTASEDTTICFWNTDTLECTTTLQAHTDLVRALAFSSDGQLLASSSDDQTISLWDTKAGSLIKILHPQSNRIWSLAFFPHSPILVSANESAREDDMLRYWDIRQGQCIRKVHSYCSLVKSVAFSPDDTLLASGSEENELRIWSIASGRCLRTLSRHTNRLRSVAFSPDGKTIASGSEDETICLWQTDTGQCRLVLQGHTHLVRSVSFSPDGAVLASASHDHTIRLWDVQTGQCLKLLQGPDNPIWCVAFHPTGNLIATAHDDHLIRLWERDTGATIRVLQGHNHRVWSVAFSPDGRTLASSSDDTTLRTWDITSGRCKRIFKGHKIWVRSVAFSSDGNLLASGSHDFTIRIWDVHSGRCLNILQGHKSCVWSVAFSPDGKTIASCSDDGTIRLWVVHSGACSAILRGDRPYERLNISHATGLTNAQKTALKTLGAYEQE